MSLNRLICFAAALMAALPFAAGGCAPTQDLSGTWTGSVSQPGAGGSSAVLPLAFHVTRKDDGSYSATVDSVAQGKTGIPMDVFSIKDNKITMSLNMVQGSFAGSVNAEGTVISGTWTQGPANVALKLTKQPGK